MAEDKPAMLDVTGLREAAAAILVNAGASPENAAVVAEHLVESETLGRLSHALRLLPTYVDRLLKGEVDGTARPAVTQDSGATLRITGNGGFGQVAGDFAADQGIERARELGISLVALRESGHLGRNGRWPERAAARGVASMHFGHSARGSSGKDFLVPHGGAEPRMRTSPMSFGAPAESGPPVVVDFAVGEMSANAVLLAAERNIRLPTKALIGPDGTPSDDPEPFTRGLSGLRPIGGHKGFALALFVEIFAGIIAGDGTAGHRRNSLLSVYIDVRRQRDWASYAAEIEAMLAHVRSARPAAGSDGVRIPGEQNPARAERAVREGLAADPRLVEALKKAALASGSLGELTRRWPRVFAA